MWKPRASMRSSMESTYVIAIDGPAGAGKSSVAQRVAQIMGYVFLDTGAMYRAATWRALHHGADLGDAEALAESTRAMVLEMVDAENGRRVLVDGMDVTEAIRAPEVTRQVCKLDQIPAVRRHLVAFQRRFAGERSTVAEGRDIGTVVFPNARCKIYLDASLEERTARRARQLAEQGIAVDLGQLRAEIHERDEQNKIRADSPLRPADDAVILDTTTLSLDDVVHEIVRLAREKL